MTARAASVVAQAKLNLGLRVLARERGGFHAIETVFVRLALGDLVRVRSTTGARTLDCRGADVGPVERNLAWRAALAYAHATGWPTGWEIEIDKHVPAEGGLGGGSADAGAVLRALNALAPHPIAEDELLALATPLGSDVPFLTSAAPAALAWGRGERMLRIPSLPERHAALVLPSFGVSTAEAYGWLTEGRGEYAPIARLFTLEQLASWESLAPLTGNDFEPVVAVRHPELPAIIARLRAAGATIARMTGSGSTLYGIFAEPPAPDSLAHAGDARVLLTTTATRVLPVEIAER
jgi:4-diphosphocytidyl-2-C-methyl-D-erythritol kinase